MVMSNTFCVDFLFCASYVVSVSGLSIRRLVHPMLSVSLDCPFDVLCILCCQCLWIVHSTSCASYVVSVSGLSIRRLVHPMLSVSLDCPFDVLCILCCQCLWIVHSVFYNVYLSLNITVSLKGILKLVLTYIFSIRDEGCFFSI